MIVACREFKNVRKALSEWLSIMMTILVLGILAVPSAVAQTGQGTISGRVADAQGGGVAGATIVITNTDTKVQTRTKTDRTGSYNMPSLLPGNYIVSAAAKGFDQAVITGVIVNEAGTVQIDVPLKVGSESISVTITAQDSLLQSTSDVSTTVDHQLVESLPYPERSSLEALLLVPGVNGDPQQPGGVSTENPGLTVGAVAPGASLTIGGTPPGQTSILVDGSDVTQAGFPRAGVNLSGQLVQESTVIVGGMSAKYGRTGSGIIVQGSRSGVNEYHGGVIWRHTDPYFNAYPLGGTSRNANHQNYYGFYLGGPVRIPKLYNGRGKTFFFAGVEPARLSNKIGVRGTFQTPDDLAGHYNNSLALINQGILSSQGYAAALLCARIGDPNYGTTCKPPTPAGPTGSAYSSSLFYQEKPAPNATAGCASAPAGFPCGPLLGSSSQYLPIYGPVADCGVGFAGTVCPNDAAPELAQNTFAQYAFSLFPTPTNPGPYITFDSATGAYATDGTNGTLLRGVQNIDNRYSFRIDQQFNNSNRMFVRYTVIPVTGARFFGLAIDNPLTQVPTTSVFTHDIAMGFTHIFTDNLVGNLRYSFLRANQSSLPPSVVLTSDTAAKYGLTPAVLGKGFPYLGGLNTGASGGVGYTLLPGEASAVASIDIDQNFIAGADFNWTHNNHFIQFGVDVRWIQSGQYDLSGLYGGKYIFSPSQTNNGSSGGDAMASFILGDISSFSDTPLAVPGYYRWRYYAGYIQDDWRATARLTVNAGLRYEVETPRMEKFNNQGIVEPVAGTLNGLPTQASFCFSGSCGFPRGLWPTNYYGLEPRLGLAYSLSSRATLRASYGISRLPLTGYENTPDPDFNVASATVGGVSGGVTPNYVVNYLTNPVGALTSAYTSLIAQGRVPVNSSTGIIPEFVSQTNSVPYLQTYGMTIQFQPASKTLVQVTYQGVRGVHLIGAFNHAVNSASLPGIQAAIQQGTYLGGQTVGNPYGISNPGSTTPLNETYLQTLYPYQNFFNQALDEIYPRTGTLKYNGLYVSVNQRMTKDLAFLSYYQWSKSLDNIPNANGTTGGGFGVAVQQNPFDQRAEYSVSSFDQASRFRGGYSYNLPFGIGERFQTHHRWIDQIIGNIMTAGIISINDGYPNYVTLGSAGYFTVPTPVGTGSVNGVGGCSASGTTKFCTTSALPVGYTLRPNIVPGVPLINKNWKKNPFNSLAGITPYLNAAAFSVPGTIGNPQLGNAPRTLADARSPRELLFDAHVAKGVTISRRYVLRLTADFNNAFNHPVYFGINNHSVLSSTSVSTVTGLATNTVAAGFADLNAGQTGNLSRVIRFGAQLTF